MSPIKMRFCSDARPTDAQSILRARQSIMRLELSQFYVFGLAGQTFPLVVGCPDIDTIEPHSIEKVSGLEFQKTASTEAMERVLRPIADCAELVELFDEYLLATDADADGLLNLICLDHQRGLLAAFERMICLVATTSPGLPRGLLAYASHSEALISQSSQPDQLRRRLASVYDRNRDDLIKRAGAIAQAGLDETRTSSLETVAGQLNPWVAANRQHRQLLLDLATRGVLVSNGDRSSSNENTLPTEFHRAIRANTELHSFMNESPLFCSLRVLLSFQYLHLFRSGITLRQRLLLSYLASRSLSDAFQCDPLDLVREFSS